MKIELKYFSGTGNSYRVLDTCKAIFSENGHKVAISSITDKTPIDPNAGLIGFCFPVYAFGIPRICRNYLSHLPTFNHSTNAFVLITAGAADEAGLSVKESVRYIKQKGLTVTYSDVIHMPSNWTVAMNPPAKDEAQEIIATGISKAKETARAILEGARYHHAFNYPARLSKFGFYKDYYLFKWLGVSNLWRNFRADETCDGCGLCEKICPTGSIRMAADNPEWLKTCEQCMRCVNYCPHKAIYQTGEGSIKGKNRYYEPTFKPLKIKEHKANNTDAKSHTAD